MDLFSNKVLIDERGETKPEPYSSGAQSQTNGHIDLMGSVMLFDQCIIDAALKNSFLLYEWYLQ